ncbi:MAG: NADPH-dependent F420 reductase [Halobacteriales archaeon]
MRIALLGGTGDIGEGLALRWAYDTNHEIIIGSREPERARTKAEEYETELSSRGIDREVAGFRNEMAADRADVVILAVPPYYVTDTIETVADRLDDDAILVSPAVGIDRNDDGFHYAPPPAGSVLEHAAGTVPDRIPLVGAFHNLPADRLANLDATIDFDTLLVGDDTDAKETVRLLAEGIDGLRALDAGDLGVAAEVETLTPLLINIAANNDGMHDPGVEFK